MNDDKYMTEIMHEVDGNEYSIENADEGYENKTCLKCGKKIITKTLWVGMDEEVKYVKYVFLCHACYRKAKRKK